MTPEGKVKKFIRQYMTQHFKDHWMYCPPGGAFGKAGAPDFLFLYKGILIAIEAKAGDNTPTKLQLKRLNELKQQGAIAAVVRGENLERMDQINKAVKAELTKRGVEHDKTN